MRAIWCAIAAAVVAGAQTPPQPRFEVASIRAVRTFDQGFPARRVAGGPGTSGTGRVEYREFSLKDLLFQAYRVPFFQLPTASWMEHAFFTIQAQVPPGAGKDDMPLMLQRLLEERFRLKIRREPSDIEGFALTIAKGGARIQRSPELASGVSETPNIGPRIEVDKEGFYILPPGTAQMLGRAAGKDGLARLTAARTSVALLCSYLTRQLQQPVVDQTGLTGIYDFRLAYVPDVAAPGSALPATIGPGTDMPDASDPAPTLYRAVEQQLGLRLQSQKVRVDRLVIDHIERTPTDN